MVNANDFYSSTLKNEDLNGRKRILTIAGVETVQFENDRPKLKLIFSEETRGLMVNVTKNNELCGAYGPETDNWIGHRVELSPGTTLFQGKRVNCIDIMALLPEQQQQQRPPQQQQQQQPSEHDQAWSAQPQQQGAQPNRPIPPADAYDDRG